MPQTRIPAAGFGPEFYGILVRIFPARSRIEAIDPRHSVAAEEVEICMKTPWGHMIFRAGVG